MTRRDCHASESVLWALAIVALLAAIGVALFCIVGAY